MTLDDRRLSRCIHLVAVGTSIAALSMFLPSMSRAMGDNLTVGVSLGISSVFVGFPTMIGLVAWSDRPARRTPVMSAFLVLCSLLAAYAILMSVVQIIAEAGPQLPLQSFGVLGMAIAFAVTAAFVRDRKGAAIS